MSLRSSIARHAVAVPALSRLAPALALALLAAVAPARAGDAEPALPAFHVGEHAHYAVQECETKSDDRHARPATVKAPSCHVHDVDLAVLAVDAGGGFQVRATAKGPDDAYPLSTMEQPTFAVRRAVAHGVPVTLAVAADGLSATLVDAPALRARVKAWFEGQVAAPARADAAQVRRIVQKTDALGEPELLSAAWGPLKTLFVAHGLGLAPASSADDQETMDGSELPIKVDLVRHVDVSALAADGQGLQVTKTLTLEGERATAMMTRLAEAMRAHGPLSPRDEAELRDALATAPFLRATTVTTIDLHTAWPPVVAQTLQMDLAHEHNRKETTFRRQ